MKKLNLPLFILSIFFLLPVAQADFPDVPTSSEYHQAVSALEDLGVIQGYPDGTFKLDQPVNRAEFLKMAYLAKSKRDSERQHKKEDRLFPFGQESTIKVDPPCFSDLDGKKWFDPYVCWGKAQGLVEGYAGGEFKAIKTVNAAEGAKMLVEVGSYSKTYAELEWPLQADHWAAGYFHAFNGPIIPPSIHSANQTLTRGEVAEWVWRSSIATWEELENKPARALPWDGEKFVALDYVGPDPHQWPLKSYYAKDEEKIYFVAVADSAIYEVENADRESFHMTYEEIGMRNNSGYIYDYIRIPIAVDDNFTFMQAKPIEGSGGKTFGFLQGSYFENQETGGTGFYGKDTKQVYLMGCADLCGIFTTLPDSDAKSFEAFYMTGFGKDKNHVYHLDQIVEDMDSETFKPLGQNIAIDKNGVYTFGELSDLDLEYMGEIPRYGERYEHYLSSEEKIYVIDDYSDQEGILRELEGADVNSFGIEPIFEEGGWRKIALDDFSLYWSGEKVEGSKGGQFELLDEEPFMVYEGLTERYARDSERVYLLACYEWCNLKGPLPDSDINSFEALGNGYSTDENQVYFLDKVIANASGFFFAPADPDTFERLLPNNEDLYCTFPFAQDDENVFLENKAITELDLQTFEFLDPYGFFFRDSDNVFRVALDGKGNPCASSLWKKIEGVHTDKFEYFSPYYFGSKGYDNRYIYHTTATGFVSPVNEADYDTFEPLVTDLTYDSVWYSYYAKDANNAYYNAQIIPEIDVESFEYDPVIKKLKDINGEYEWLQISHKLGLNLNIPG